MRTASMVLGIIGCIVVMLWGLINFIITGFPVMSVDVAVAAALLGVGICIFGAGILGLIGGIIVKRKNVAAGVVMIIAAVLSIFSFFNVIAIILFVLGAIFALVREKPVSSYPAYSQPVYTYCQDPRYPQYPQYPYQQQPPVQQNAEDSQE